MHADDLLDTAIARHVWSTRYRRVGPDGRPEPDVAATWRRVARAVAAPEGAAAAEWEDRFADILGGFRFLPGGRILAGAGTGRRVTLFNCFVMGPIEDDLEGIFEALEEGALTLQAGGGIGYDFSTLRPAGTASRSTGRTASGPVPFLGMWDAMCGALLSTGARRGAMLASLRCDHPDIEAFIDAKREPGRLTRFNLSVQVSDALMRAVDRDEPWPLVFPTDAIEDGGDGAVLMRAWPGKPRPVPCRVFASVPARALWDRLTRSCYDTGEPGVLFTDTIDRLDNLGWRETITTTNPCGEVPLPPYGACNLGSVNLVRFVREPFTPRASLDHDALRALVPVAVRLLDDVIDISHFPLQAQADEALGARRIGLGLTGLADALILLGLDYGSEAGRAAAARAMQCICETAYQASIELAREKGPFPFFVRDAFLESSFVRGLPGEIRDGIARHGIRNGQLTAIAPTGTISLLAGNVSSGIEPVFDHAVCRAVLDESGKPRSFDLEDHACREWRRNRGGDGLPPAFVRAHEIAPSDHLHMQAAVQRHVDAAISKTVNVPADCPFEEFRDIYRLAHRLGLKGCTTWRPNEARGAVLAPDLHCCAPGREGD